VTKGQVVRRVRPSDAAPAEAGDSEAVHVLFNILGSRRLSLPDIASPYAGAVYLGHRILENPADFRSHVQRILLLIDRGDEIDLQGALVDLYIALGDKGEGLKRRLLELAAPRLSRTVQAFLKQRMASGLKPWEAAVSRMRSSLLSLGFSGVHELVGRREASNTSGYADAVEEARACLEYGQVDEAREVLERALRQDPGNDVIAAELMEIYQYTRDDERLAIMRQFLLDAAPSEPEDWREESPNTSEMPQLSGATRSWVAQPINAQARL
jgi:tetratricopeptide (TPR) repeat protein